MVKAFVYRVLKMWNKKFSFSEYQIILNFKDLLPALGWVHASDLKFKVGPLT
jgi:hypothetical protein